MIQRIQSVYFILAIVCLILPVAFGFSSYTFGEDHVIFNLFGVSENLMEVNTWFPYKFVIPFIAAMCLFALLQFKKRKLQLNVGKIIMLLIFSLIGFIFIDVYTLGEKLFGVDAAFEFSIGAGTYLPVAALPFVILANRAIKKDEALIKSVDRLR